MWFVLHLVGFWAVYLITGFVVGGCCSFKAFAGFLQWLCCWAVCLITGFESFCLITGFVVWQFQACFSGLITGFGLMKLVMPF